MAGVISASCIRDEIEDCPPLRVRIAVKDKNYFNVDKVDLEDRLAENLPLRSYVPTIYWVLRDADTGKIVDESRLITVTGEEETYSPEICPCVPHGRFVLTVWGGLSDLSPLGGDPATIDFHPGNVEGDDIYLTSDTLQYDAWHNDYTVELERTKGKLIVEKLNLPEGVDGSQKQITGLYSRVDNRFGYSGETQVVHQHVFNSMPQIVTKTLLSPSLGEEASELRFDFKGPETVAPPRPVKITMKRNQLTVLRYVWNTENENFDIYILINNNWELITKLEID